MSRFEPAAGLDQRIAALIRPKVDRLTEDVRDAAQRGAPGVKVWVTARDERVRDSHVRTDGQAVPENLRFKVPKANAGSAGFDLARHPRDPSLPVGNRINCRCEDPLIEGLLAQSIHALPAVLDGTRIVGTVETRFPRAPESENGTSEDQAAHFMAGALREVAARLGVRQTRRL